MLKNLLIWCVLLLAFSANATHIVGGEIMYKYKQKVGNNYRYEITLYLYVDCLNGAAGAIKDDATAFINVFYENSSELIVPNIFTPNGDGTNDLFIMTATGIKTFNAVIYNRWGIKIVEWNSILSGWDGRFITGNEASEGTYFYMIKASAFDGKEYNLRGAFHLVK